MSVSPEELACRRWRPFRKAVEKRDRLVRELNETTERIVAARERLPAAEQADREAFAAALAAGRDEPERAATALAGELERLQRRVEACQLAVTACEGEIVQLRTEHGPGWLREAQTEFTRAREAYEQALAAADHARVKLEQEAALCAFVAGNHVGLRLASNLSIPIAGVEGADQRVPAAGVLEAMRDAVTDLELDVLTTRA